MARQRPMRLIMGPCISEIDRIVKTEDQHQLEVNRCRNEEVIVKGNYGWVWPMWAGRPRLRLTVNRCRNEEIIVKGNFGWVWPMWAGRPRLRLTYQLEVNRCRNEEVIAPQVEIDRIVIREVQYQLKEMLGGCGLCGRGAPRLVMGPCIAGIDRIVIREVQYQFEVNRCRNEEIIVKGNLGWVWPIRAGRPRVGNVAMHNVQYQFEVNRCRNEEIIVTGNFGWAWSMWAWSMWAGHPRVRNGAMNT
ncbi:hypothetical protein DPMN_006690 [Dreissena polymorpha]|uniref:Uncharacterized protein n=1 Tax=Dreissena polymorpha TaxID=45954 RepID=A0A9D4MV24_DREPO|nr:hypothetical protein DPMN_006690 [Dreissena polymorpha]